MKEMIKKLFVTLRQFGSSSIEASHGSFTPATTPMLAHTSKNEKKEESI
jgi:hypothetical protein